MFVPCFQGPGFWGSSFFRVQDFQGQGPSGSRFFRVRVFQGPDFSGSGSRVRVKVLEVATLQRRFLEKVFWKYAENLQENTCECECDGKWGGGFVGGVNESE